jgi:chemotaxis-related protein WspD
MSVASTNCWNQIGVAGDASCPELRRYYHCQNCPVFQKEGKALFDRPAPPGYLREWTDAVAEPIEDEREEELPVVVFRLGSEWFALNTRFVREATNPKPIHSVPGRSGKIFLGIAAVRGELELCASLHGLLEIDDSTPPRADAYRVLPRLLAVERGDERWAFAVDELDGVHRFPLSMIGEAPATVSRSRRSFTKGLIEFGGGHVGLLDENALFDGLAGSLQ